MPVAADATEFPTFNVTVNDTAPTWFYVRSASYHSLLTRELTRYRMTQCKQHFPNGTSHCGAGMVFAINAVADSNRSFAAFQELAIQLNGTGSGSASGSGSGASPSSTQPSGAGSAYAINALVGLGTVAAVMSLIA